MYKPPTQQSVRALESWQDKSACRGMGSETFYTAEFARGPLKRNHEAMAKAVCATCPVAHQCLAWALEFAEPYGIWGGLTPEERDARRLSEGARPDQTADRLDVRAAHRRAPADHTTNENRLEYG